MSVHLISGAPGSGKTLRAVQALYNDGEVFKLRLDDGTSRPIYVCGLDGELPGIDYVRLDYGFDWRKLDKGSLVVVDEAHYQWPAPNFTHLQRGRLEKDEQQEQVLDLSMHRHKGFDFILTSQNPFQLHWAIKGFVTRHEHIVLRRGTKTASNIFSMNEYFTYSADVSAVDKQKWDFPKSMFGKYKSAEIHDKRSSPMLSSVRNRLVMIGMLFLSIIGLMGYSLTSSDGAGISFWDYVLAPDEIQNQDDSEFLYGDIQPFVQEETVGLRDFVLSEGREGKRRWYIEINGWCIVEGLSDHFEWYKNQYQCEALDILESQH